MRDGDVDVTEIIGGYCFEIDAACLPDRQGCRSEAEILAKRDWMLPACRTGRDARCCLPAGQAGMLDAGCSVVVQIIF